MKSRWFLKLPSPNRRRSIAASERLLEDEGNGVSCLRDSFFSGRRRRAQRQRGILLRLLFLLLAKGGKVEAMAMVPKRYSIAEAMVVVWGEGGVLGRMEERRGDKKSVQERRGNRRRRNGHISLSLSLSPSFSVSLSLSVWLIRPSSEEEEEEEEDMWSSKQSECE